MRKYIDLDDPATWPEPVRVLCFGLADAARRSRLGIDVLDTHDPDAEANLRLLLQGYRVRAYHGTRLLDHERDDVRTNGLCVLTPEFVDERIENAHRHGCIDDAERKLLLASSVFRSRQPEPSRAGFVFLFTAHAELENPWRHGLHHMLEEWGGEAILMSAESRDLPPHLVTLGKPTVVVAAVEFGAPDRLTDYLHYGFVRTLLEAGDGGVTVTCTSDVRGCDIIAILQPGNPEYDHYPELARS